MKRSAACEKGEITSKQAIDRIRAIVYKEAGTKLPEDVLRFYAEEYQAMVRSARKP